jgi:hypothetical protein
VTTHLGVMVLFAACVASVFGALLRDDLRDQVRLAARVFTILVLAAYGLGWVMFVLFG